MTDENTVTASSGDVFKDLGLGTVEEFTRKRLDEVSQRLTDIEAERDALVLEHKQLVKTAKAIGIVPRISMNGKHNQSQGGKRVTDHIVEILMGGPQKSREIRNALAGRGVHFKAQPTLNSHLTLLKHRNVVINEGRIWRLVDKKV